MKGLAGKVWMLVVIMALGCGGSSGPKNIAFLYVVGQGQNAIEQFHQESDGEIAALAVPAVNTAPRPVAMALHPSKNFIYVANLTSNTVSGYTIDHTTGVLAPIGSALPPTPTGPGPIAVGVASNGQFLYVLNTGTSAGSISAFSIDATRGLLTEIAGSPFAAPASPQVMVVSSSTGFLYVATAGSPTTPSAISGFAIGSNGSLAPIAGSFTGPAATNITAMALDPKGQFLYAADSGNSKVFSLGVAASGALSPVAGSPFAAGTQTTGVAVDATGTLVFASNAGSNDVSAYTTNAGVLTQVSGSPFSTVGAGTVAATQPGFLTVDQSNVFLYVCDVATKGVAAFTIAFPAGTLTPVTNSPFGQVVNPSWIISTQ